MRDVVGLAPLVPSKLASVVKVCAGEAIAVAAYRATTPNARFPQFSLPNALTIRLMDVLLFEFPPFHCLRRFEIGPPYPAQTLHAVTYVTVRCTSPCSESPFVR